MIDSLESSNFSVKILKVKSEIVSKILPYIQSLSYQTYSYRQRKFVVRNTFHVQKLEAEKEGTVIWLHVFGRNVDQKFEHLKIFIRDLEDLMKEKDCKWKREN